MAHFAELDENNIVLRVTVVSNADLLDENGNEVEALGVAVCEQQLGGRWVQTSYNGNFRKKYAAAGDRYDEAADVFVRRQPFPSWILNDEYEWQPPTPKPTDDATYTWDEDTLSWVVVPEPADE